MLLSKAQISEKLQIFLAKRGCSIYRLSKITGLDKATLNRIINGQCLPRPCTMECICHAFKISVTEFLEVTPDTPKTDKPFKAPYPAVTSHNIHISLRNRLREKSWSLYRLTKEARLSKNTLYNSIKRNNIPDYETMLKICEALEINPVDFLDFYI